MKRLAGVVAMCLVLGGPSSAGAAIEVGSHCEAGVALIPGIEGTAFPLAVAAGGDLSAATPISGIATSWTVHSGSTDSFQQRLKVLRTVPGTDTVQAVAEAGPTPVVKGSGSFPIRIPVLAGDRFGLNSPSGAALVCSTNSPDDVIGVTVRNPQPGQSEKYFLDQGYQVAVSVVVEPDSDGDGYGDETQEPCPERITVQVDCPPVTFEKQAEVKRRAVLVRISVSSEATAQILGWVAWQVRAASERKRKLAVELTGGETRTVLSNWETTFRLPLGMAVRRRLEQLEPPRALQANLTILVTDLAGRVTQQQFRIRLRGRG